MSLLLSGAHVVTALDPPDVRPADVLVEDGRITGLGENAPDSWPAVLDCSGCLIIPGNVCAHTHAYSALARGMPYRLPAPASFLEILQRIWWRLDRALDEASIRASALVAAREAVLAGTTTLIDHHASPNAIDGSLDVIAAAFAEVGIRSVLCYETSDRDGPPRAAAGLAENRRFLGAVADGRFPLSAGMVGAHASFTLSPDTLAGCARLARETGARLHVHVAEDAVDEIDAVRRYGHRVVERLASADALDAGALLAHAIHIDETEARLVRVSAATVVHSPRSNMNNAVGRAPLRLLGSRVALGTDGIGADMFEESRVGWLRRREEDTATPMDWPLVRLAEGQRLAGRTIGEPLLGRLEVGAPADVVVLSYDPPTPLVSTSLAGHWAFGLSSALVRDVIVAGQIVVRDRHLTRLDEAALAAAAHGEATRLWTRMDAIDPHPFDPLDVPRPIGAPNQG